MFYDIDRLMFILESTGKTYNTEKIKKHMNMPARCTAGNIGRAARNI